MHVISILYRSFWCTLQTDALCVDSKSFIEVFGVSSKQIHFVWIVTHLQSFIEVFGVPSKQMHFAWIVTHLQSFMEVFGVPSKQIHFALDSNSFIILYGSFWRTLQTNTLCVDSNSFTIKALKV